MYLKNPQHDELSMYIFFAFFALNLTNAVLSLFSEKDQEVKNVETNDNLDEKKLVKYFYYSYIANCLY